MHKLLVIDDDETVRDVLHSVLTEKGFEPVIAENGEAGLALIKSERFDLIVTDLVMPGVGGMDILAEVSASKIGTPVILLTAHGTVQNAVDAMKLGAYDYVTKPFNLDEIMMIIEKALSHAKLQKENAMLRMQLRKRYNFKGLIGHSEPMQKVYELIEKIADTDSTVLILGESGTGKELIAKTIHFNSSRAQGPFVPLNCAAIPKDLLESELFGHEKGAFTGAVNTRLGRFELAQNGTIFLDEVAELAPELQVKLLRVIQEREFERVGGMKTIKVDVRILAATNKDLEQNVEKGLFREDLFYRLNVIPVQLPPLRERTEDLPLLMDHFVHEFAKKRKRDPLAFSPRALALLQQHSWPGNVRELENLIERLSILVNGDKVKVEDLPEKIRQAAAGEGTEPEQAAAPRPGKAAIGAPGAADLPEGGLDLNNVIGSLEKDLIKKALERTGGVRSKAAQLLGLNRTTLIEKIKKMNIS